MHLGVNVGYEIDGKQRDFSRPVVVLRKYNQYSFLALPLTTTTSRTSGASRSARLQGEEAFAVLSQLRNIDSRAPIEKKGHVAAELLALPKESGQPLNFG